LSPLSEKNNDQTPTWTLGYFKKSHK
jgi:hypothetical protein